MTTDCHALLSCRGHCPLIGSIPVLLPPLPLHRPLGLRVFRSRDLFCPGGISSNAVELSLRGLPLGLGASSAGSLLVGWNAVQSTPRARAKARTNGHAGSCVPRSSLDNVNTLHPACSASCRCDNPACSRTVRSRLAKPVATHPPCLVICISPQLGHPQYTLGCP
jgi:hypothetical protein